MPKIKTRCKQYLLPKPENKHIKHRYKSLLLGLIFLAGIFLTDVSPSLLKPVTAQVNSTPATPNSFGQELLQQVVQCVREKIPNFKQANQTAIQAASSQCMLQVAVLAPDGSVRQDASDRMAGIIEATGVKLPQPVSQGQANVPIKFLPDSKVFSVPVQIGGQTQNFLLDTGASASIIDNQLAKKLNLKGTPVSSEMLKFMVVGNDCSNIQANYHALPTLAVNSATVSGLNGMGLSQTPIPGKTSGVLGLDFLSNFDVVVNPEKLQLQLLPPSPANTEAIPLQGKLGNIITQVKINGQGPFKFLLDTGADIMVVSKPLAAKLGIDDVKAKKTSVTGFCGTEKARKIKLAQVSLQQHQANQIDGVILDNSNIFNLLGIEGIVGQSYLTKYQQHWHFGKRNALGFVDSGSLVLTPLVKK
jgi:clan AA aspartic protease (TIGR02281 family)